MVELKMDKRIGKFRISREIIENHPETARAIIERCTVIKGEWVLYSSALECLAFSPEFDELPLDEFPLLDEPVPMYIVEINENGTCIKFKRMIYFGDHISPTNSSEHHFRDKVEQDCVEQHRRDLWSTYFPR
jgi:hypothetical protein